MNAICIVKCKDCGPFQIFDEKLLTIFSVDEEYYAITICTYCERSIKVDLQKTTAQKLMLRNVKYLNWNNNE